MAIPPSYWSNLAFHLNAALDEGRKTSYAEARKAFQDGKALEYLRSQKIDASLLEAHAKEANEFFAALCSGNFPNRDRRKFGVEQNGLCLALAYAVEAVQQTFPELRA